MQGLDTALESPRNVLELIWRPQHLEICRVKVCMYKHVLIEVTGTPEFIYLQGGPNTFGYMVHHDNPSTFIWAAFVS